MVLRKGTKEREKTVSILEVPVDSDLPGRLQSISEQTGLSSHDLLQKWILQEESWIRVIQRGKEAADGQAKRMETSPDTSDLAPQTEEADADNSDYRKTLVDRVRKLKKEGVTLTKIAEIFNEENLTTVSGKGKWYSSSIAWLLDSDR
ncbi:MAG: recombinase family protein [Synergistaceae bacterium]|jgi:hypothetical protein|nr:recombinase family protein [Synergistaceae bacterium]